MDGCPFEESRQSPVSLVFTKKVPSLICQKGRLGEENTSLRRRVAGVGFCFTCFGVRAFRFKAGLTVQAQGLASEQGVGLKA